MNLLAQLFTHPRQLSDQMLWLVVPVSLAVAIVYKTVRTRSLRRLPLEIAGLSLLMSAGVAALIAVGWLFVWWQE